ncbi:MAG: hypothetical protein EAX96_02260 [Candidatus Lokiarchaeota archaeon]|nr:hypothetical protein [Candidatus Lokiarchaeota archaeon]
MQFNVNEFINILIITGIVIIVVWLSEVIISNVIKRKFSKSKRLPKDAINGIQYLIRFIAAIIILFSLLYGFGIFNASAILSFSTIFSTAIGFACAIAVGNLVAGFYIMITRPYHIGDYIQTGDLEGFVLEIGLNYTKIEDATTNIIYQIPNRIAMGENLVIYKAIKDESKIKKEESEHWLDIDFKDLKGPEKLDKYVFKIETELNLDPDILLQKLDNICNKWESTFKYRPKYRFESISWRTSITIIITSDKMKDIQSQLDKFLDDIWISLYSNKEGP